MEIPNLIGSRGTAIAYLSYDRVAAFVDDIAVDLIACGYAAAVGILRGGAFPAVLASYATGIPVFFLRYDRPHRRVSWDSSGTRVPAPGSRILLCEDMAGRGHTLADCKDFLIGLGYSVDVLAAAFDSLSREKPKFGIDLRGKHVVFPWERQWNAAVTAGTELGDEHQYQIWAFDLDGVFLHDIPPETYQTDLQGTLALRDTLPLVVVPFHVPPDAVIVTARPLCDVDRTRAWLDGAGLGHLRLEMRREATPGVLPSALHKAEVCVRLGITHFVESDAAQAIEIAALAPWVRVLKWNAADRRGRWVGAIGDSATITLFR